MAKSEMPSYIKSLIQEHKTYKESRRKDKWFFWQAVYNFVDECAQSFYEIDKKIVMEKLLDQDWTPYEYADGFLAGVNLEDVPELADCIAMHEMEEEAQRHIQEEEERELTEKRIRNFIREIIRWARDPIRTNKMLAAKAILENVAFRELLNAGGPSELELDVYSGEYGATPEEVESYIDDFLTKYQGVLEVYPYMMSMERKTSRAAAALQRREEKILDKAESRLEDKIKAISSKIDQFEEALRALGTNEEIISNLKNEIINSLEGAEALSDIEKRLEEKLRQVEEKVELPPMSEKTFEELMDTLPASAIETIINTGQYLGHSLTIDQVERASEVLRSKEAARMGMENFEMAAVRGPELNIDMSEVLEGTGAYEEEIGLVSGEDTYFKRIYRTIDGNTARVLSSITGVPVENITASPYRIAISRLDRLDTLVDITWDEAIKRGLSKKDMEFLLRLRDFVRDHYDELYPPNLLTLDEAEAVGVAMIKDAPKAIIVDMGMEGFVDIAEQNGIFYVKENNGDEVSLIGQESYIAAATASLSKSEKDNWEFAEWFERYYHGDVEKGIIAVIALDLYSAVPYAAYHILWKGLHTYIVDNPQVVVNLMENRGVSFELTVDNINFMGETIARSVFGVKDWPYGRLGNIVGGGD